MQDHDFTVHANVNQHGRDHALRVSFARYSRDGYEDTPITWRGHADVAQFDSPIDQAWVALLCLMKLLEKNGACGRVSGIYDEPLGWSEH